MASERLNNRNGLKIHAGLTTSKREAQSLFVDLTRMAASQARIDDGFVVGGMETPYLEDGSFHIITATNLGDVGLTTSLDDVFKQHEAAHALASPEELLNRLISEMQRANGLIPVYLRPSIIGGRVWSWCENGVLSMATPYKANPETAHWDGTTRTTFEASSEYRAMLPLGFTYLN